MLPPRRARSLTEIEPRWSLIEVAHYADANAPYELAPVAMASSARYFPANAGLGRDRRPSLLLTSCTAHVMERRLQRDTVPSTVWTRRARRNATCPKE